MKAGNHPTLPHGLKGSLMSPILFLHPEIANYYNNVITVMPKIR
jgi:hypothetical protein